jgi:hypothetical protein
MSLPLLDSVVGAQPLLGIRNPVSLLYVDQPQTLHKVNEQQASRRKLRTPNFAGLQKSS